MINYEEKEDVEEEEEEDVMCRCRKHARKLNDCHFAQSGE